MCTFVIPRRLRPLLSGTSALAGLALASAAQAGQPGLPTNGSVTVGSATIAQAGAKQLTVTTGTSRTVIDWQSFSIAGGNKVAIQQPGASSITVNEVVGQDPSKIFGDLSSNGRVVLANPNGIWFGPNAHVDVAGLVASTATLSADAKKAFASGGRLSLDVAGKSTASIVNDGQMTIAGAGLAALVAPGVRNNGVIEASLGSVTLASGQTSTLDFYGDGLVSLAVTSPVQAVAIGPDGKPFKATIENNGKLAAQHVLVTADVVKGMIDNSINMSGVVEAKGVTVSGGDIVLDGGAGDVTVAGMVDVTSQQARGGSVAVTGGTVTLASAATIDASGAKGGGTVEIGGGAHGGGPLKHATTVLVQGGSTILANALSQGDGGTVSIWSDGQTTFNGIIEAKGAGTGTGGWIETSGHAVSISTGLVEASGGTWLLDPADLTIDTALAATIETSLDAGTNVTQQTNASGSGGNGDIFVTAPIAWTTSAALTLSAYRNIAVDAGLTSTGGGAVTLHADNSGTGTGTVSFANAAKATTSGAVAIFYNPGDNPVGSLVNATSYTSPTDYTADVAGGATLTASMLVNSVYDLQNVQNNLAGTYALGRDIDAGATANWNSGAGFTPIGEYEDPFVEAYIGEPFDVAHAPFTGSFSGAGYTIAHLTIDRPYDYEVGLFAENAGSLTSMTMIGTTLTGGTRVGGLAGLNSGSITGSSVSGTFAATGSGVLDISYSVDPVGVGALVGDNSGTIKASSSSGTVTNASQLDQNSTEFDMGGLVGINGGLISQSSSSATVNGAVVPIRLAAAGGLAGRNDGTIIQSSATGAVEGGVSYADPINPTLTYAGGLVGLNSGGVSLSFSTGTPSGAGDIGGLVGENSIGGTITQSHASGGIPQVYQFGASVGGLVGENDGTITLSYATGMVVGSVGGGTGCGDYGSGCPVPSYTGGLVGLNSGTITYSFATGQVVGSGSVDGLSLSGFFDTGVSSTGGLVGSNGGSISYSYETGNVSQTVQANSGGALITGGLVGHNTGHVTQSYAAGAVTGGNQGAVCVDGRCATSGSVTGGLVGYNDVGASIVDSYALGAVIDGGSSIYIDFQHPSGVQTASSTGGLLGINQGTVTRSYSTGVVTLITAGDALGGLIGVNTATAGSVAQSYWDVTTSGQSTSAGGTGLTTAQLSAQSSYGAGWDFAAIWYLIPGLTHPILRSELYSTVINTPDQLELIGQNATTLAGQYTLGAVIDLGPVLADRANHWATSGAAAGGGTGFVPIGNETTPFTGSFDGQGHAIANLTETQYDGVEVGLFAGNTGSLTSMTLTGVKIIGGSYVGGLVGDNTGLITGSSVSGSVFATGFTSYFGAGTNIGGEVGGLVGANGGTITMSSSSGTVSTSEPFFTDMGGLVGFNFGSISQSFSTSAVTGSGLYVALEFLTSGGLVGQNVGSITTSYATGNVNQQDADPSSSGNLYAGGLVGYNSGKVTQSYATGTVTGGNPGGTCFVGSCEFGSSETGGLVGFNAKIGSIADSYALGAVIDGGSVGYVGQSYPSGIQSISDTGGLVGFNQGTVTRSYSTGAVSLTTAGDALGGLIGVNTAAAGSVTQSYWDVTTSGQSLSAGGTGLTTAQLSQQGNYGPGWDFDATWYLITGLTHPILRSELYSTVINTPDQLELIGQNATTLAGLYTLGASIDLGPALADPANHWATAGAAADGSAGFIPIGNGTTPFTGSFDGQGGTIANLTISDMNDHLIGLFGLSAGTIKNLVLTNATIGAGTNFDVANDGGAILGGGALAGENDGTISNVSVTGTVGDLFYTTFTVGGLVGVNTGTITGASAAVAVMGDTQLGGLAGTNSGTIGLSSATGAVTIGEEPFIADAGGLVGVNSGTVTQSNAQGKVLGDGLLVTEAMGGLIGKNTGTIDMSFATGAVAGGFGDGSETDIGGLVGINAGTITASHATGVISSLGADASPNLIQVGGLVGVNIGTISQSYATGTTSFGDGGMNDLGGNFDTVGGLVGDNRGAILSSYATGHVFSDENEAYIFGSEQYAGGLVGLNEPGATVASSYATGTVGVAPGIIVPGNIGVGGLIGVNYGSVTSSYATGAVTGGEAAGFATGFAPLPGHSDTGGLVGDNEGVITGSYATGAVVGGGVLALDPSSPPLLGNGESTVGGLVGVNMGTIGTSHATGTVSEASSAVTAIILATGGLVGDGGGAIQQSYATGAVTASGTNADVGGLVGWARFAMVRDSFATGSVTSTGAGSEVGGLVGFASFESTIKNTYAAGAVVSTGGQSSVGGLVGSASNSIVRQSHATGAVSGSGNIGGLIGVATDAIVLQTYASGAVTATGNGSNVGGLIGWHYASTLSQSDASGAVTSTGSGDRVGGLVGYGWIGGNIDNSYATGRVTANGDHTAAGGLVGFLFDSSLSSSYSTGTVTGIGLKQGVYYGYGGLVGLDIFGTVTQSYWDTDTSGQATSADGTGLTTAQLRAALPAGFSPTIWAIVPAGGFPYLRWQASP